MTAKIQNKKTKRQKNAYEMTFRQKVAFVADSSVNTVKKVFSGERSDETKMGENIVVAATLIKEGESRLLAEVKRVLSK